MSALGHKRTFRSFRPMSALPPKADIHFSFGTTRQTDNCRYSGSTAPSDLLRLNRQPKFRPTRIQSLEHAFAERPSHARHSRNPEPRAGRIERLRPALSLLLQVDGLIVSGLVELCTPYLVYALVVGPAESHGRAEPNVEVVKIFEGSNQSFGVELCAIALQRCDQHRGVYIAFKRYEVWRVPREIFGERRFVLEDQRRVAIDRRYDLRHDHPSCVPFAQEH